MFPCPLNADLTSESTKHITLSFSFCFMKIHGVIKIYDLFYLGKNRRVTGAHDVMSHLGMPVLCQPLSQSYDLILEVLKIDLFKGLYLRNQSHGN